MALWATAERPDAAQNSERQATTQKRRILRVTCFSRFCAGPPPPPPPRGWFVSHAPNPSCCLFLKIRCAAVQHPDARSLAHRVGECNGCHRNHVAVLHLPGMPAPSSRSLPPTHTYTPTPN